MHLHEVSSFRIVVEAIVAVLDGLLGFVLFVKRDDLFPSDEEVGRPVPEIGDGWYKRLVGRVEGIVHEEGEDAEAQEGALLRIQLAHTHDQKQLSSRMSSETYQCDACVKDPAMPEPMRPRALRCHHARVMLLILRCNLRSREHRTIVLRCRVLLQPRAMRRRIELGGLLKHDRLVFTAAAGEANADSGLGGRDVNAPPQRTLQRQEETWDESFGSHCAGRLVFLIRAGAFEGIVSFGTAVWLGWQLGCTFLGRTTGIVERVAEVLPGVCLQGCACVRCGRNTGVGLSVKSTADGEESKARSASREVWLAA